MLGQLLAEQAAALNVEGGVDRFVRNLHRRLLWIFLLQGARNLLRRPVQLETSHDLGPQLGMECQLGRLRPPALPILDAIARSELAAANPREISSRSCRLRAICDLFRGRGWIPPAARTWARTDFTYRPIWRAIRVPASPAFRRPHSSAISASVSRCLGRYFPRFKDTSFQQANPACFT